MSIEELSKICDESGAKLKNKMIVAISNYKKDIFNMTTDDWICLLKDFKIQTVAILEIKREVSKIYEYGIGNGYTVYNPFLSPELSAENISAQINQFIYVSQKQLSLKVEKLSDNLVGGCISQLIYEGAKSYTDVYELDMNNIDFANSRINFNGYTVNASTKLMDYIRRYNENEVYITRHYATKSGEKSYKLRRVRDNSFAKIISYSDFSENEQIEISMKSFKNSCTQIFMKLGFSSSQIYNSGMLNYIFKKCDYSLTELSILFEDNSRPRGIKSPVEKLDEYAREYGFAGKNIRYYLKDYYTSFMLQSAI